MTEVQENTIRRSSDPSAEFRYFIFDQNNCNFVYYASASDRDADSQSIIGDYCDDGWDESVEQIVAGEITHTCEQVDVVKRPPEDEIDDEGNDRDGDYWAEEWGHKCHYALLPLAERAENDSSTMAENNDLRLWVHVAEVDGLDVIQLPAYGTKEAAEQGVAMYGEQYRARVRVVPLAPELPMPINIPPLAAPDLQPCAWLVTGSPVFRDTVVMSEALAREHVARRADGSRVVPLAPLSSLVAHHADVREAAKAYRRGADVASVESGFIAGAEWQRSQASAAPELWAVHVQGPDELYAAFSREDADQHVAALNALPMPPGMKADALGAVVIRSPWSEAEHWRYLAEQERDHKNDLIAAALKRQGQLKGDGDAPSAPDADDEFYVCQSCGHEGHPDQFGKNCPACGVDLDELEASAADAAGKDGDA